MDKKTRDALEASIKHWEENSKVTIINEASIRNIDCSLCVIFNNIESNNACVGCPVFNKTGDKLCKSTPYVNAADMWDNDQLEDFKEAAKEELKFLKSLREEIK